MYIVQSYTCEKEDKWFQWTMESFKKRIESWTLIVKFSTLELIKCTWLIPLITQDLANKEWTRNQYGSWIIMRALIHHELSNEELWSSKSSSLTYYGHINVVIYLPWWYVSFGIISIVANLWCRNQDIGWTHLDS